MKFQVPFYLNFSISCRYASQFLLILQLSEICAAALSGKIFFLFPSSKLNSTWRTSNMKKFSSLTVFKKHLLKEIRHVLHSVYNICYPNGLKLLTRLRLGLSHLNEHRFNHNFKNCINPLCTCSLEVKSTSHFFLHCHYYDSIRHIMFNELCEVDINLPNASDEKLVKILL